jgi:uncharacterized membrane protein
MFKKNESPLDRAVRAVAGAGLLIGAFAGAGISSVLGIILAIVGVVLLFTAATGWCALYKLFGISTAK